MLTCRQLIADLEALASPDAEVVVDANLDLPGVQNLDVVQLAADGLIYLTTLERR